MGGGVAGAFGGMKGKRQTGRFALPAGRWQGLNCGCARCGDFGLLDYWIIGLLDYWIIGLLDGWMVGCGEGALGDSWRGD
jgi:hypothetical protein